MEELTVSSKPNRLLLTIFFTLGLLAVFGIRVLQVQGVERERQFIPQTSMLTLAPPFEAISGTFLTFTSSVKKLARDAEEFTTTAVNEPILQGEVVATERDGGIVIEFPAVTRLTFYESTEIEMANLIPPHVLFRHRRGTVSYENTGTDTLSIRALSTLVTLAPQKSASMRISQDLTTLTISGTVTFALVDQENTTNVYTLAGTQTAIVDDEARTVDIE